MRDNWIPTPPPNKRKIMPRAVKPRSVQGIASQKAPQYVVGPNKRFVAKFPLRKRGG